MNKILAKASSSLSKKRQYFCYIFRQKYFKNHNIGNRFWATFFQRKNYVFFLTQNAIFWVIFLTNSSGHPGGSSILNQDFAATIYFNKRK
jgi:hypothetical protein